MVWWFSGWIVAPRMIGLYPNLPMWPYLEKASLQTELNEWSLDEIILDYLGRLQIQWQMSLQEIKGKTQTHRGTQWRESLVKTDVEIRAMRPQAREYLGPPEASVNSSTLNFWPPTIREFCFKPPICVNCFGVLANKYGWLEQGFSFQIDIVWNHGPSAS